LLVRIAAAAAKDPFAKVKNLIQELIERLLAEAAEEANHKGWCDKEMSSATIQRDEKAEEIKELNTKLEVSEARRAKLRELVATLEKELEKLEKSMSEADDLRAKEKEENEATIEEAKEARDAVADAIQTLERFYKTAAKNEALLVVQAREAMKSHRASLLAQRTKASPEEDAPDAGFDDSYSGDQGGSSGVIGMLEVVKSDFERTISETEKNEQDAEADHREFGTTSGKSKATKETAKEEHEAALRDADAADEEDRSSLVSAQDALNKALGELDSLHKACIDDGQSPEEKAQQREEELEALKQALCIMEAHGSSGADSC
jgi:chromosome segregation ATPase